MVSNAMHSFVMESAIANIARIFISEKSEEHFQNWNAPRCCCMYCGYSYRIASMGSSDAAFFAGYHPKNTPVTVHTANDNMTE